MPAARHASRSPCMALAVIATMGIVELSTPPSGGRMRCEASIRWRSPTAWLRPRRPSRRAGGALLCRSHRAEPQPRCVLNAESSLVDHQDRVRDHLEKITVALFILAQPQLGLLAFGDVAHIDVDAGSPPLRENLVPTLVERRAHFAMLETPVLRSGEGASLDDGADELWVEIPGDLAGAARQRAGRKALFQRPGLRS